MAHKVELTYFKQTGKYYSDSEYESNKQDLWEIWDEVRELAKYKRLPGIFGSEFYILVKVPTHEHNHPRLIIPMELERHG